MLFFFNDTATTEIYTLSLHDALPIYAAARTSRTSATRLGLVAVSTSADTSRAMVAGLSGVNCGLGLPVARRSEEHTSELQSRQYLVCRLLLEKKKRREVYYLCKLHSL